MAYELAIVIIYYYQTVGKVLQIAKASEGLFLFDRHGHTRKKPAPINRAGFCDFRYPGYQNVQSTF